MVFHSPNFLIFFIGLLILFYTFKRARLIILAVGNALFYAAAGWKMLLLFVLITLITYVAAQLIYRKGWKWPLWLGIALNVANLAFFKYIYFIADTVETLLHKATEQGWLGSVPLDIVLPIGISFYTFQFISYLVDIKRGLIAPTRSLLKFWVFISLFPQLVAGPIMRGDELIPELDRIQEKRIRLSEIKYGVYLVALGLIKKMLLADQISVYVNELYAKSEALTGVESWWAAYGFGFQIYFDFSAYSDIALGLGYMMGIKLVQNFLSPYISGSPSEFWSRWHISLSRWIRDYIYIPLGGNRKHPMRVQFNLLAAMMISGLWHGAMWTFVWWGALHGILQIVHRWSLGLNRWSKIATFRQGVLYRIVAVFLFFHIVSWTWVFFRAESLTQAWDMTMKMVSVSWVELFTSGPMLVIAGLYALHLLEYALRQHENTVARWWHRVPFILRSAVYALLIMLLIYFQKGEAYEFIYFQF